MKVEVSIERDKDGRLHGYVLERGEDMNGDQTVKKGIDLLKRRYITRAESARREIDGKIGDIFRLLAPPTVTYIYPDGQ